MNSLPFDASDFTLEKSDDIDYVVKCTKNAVLLSVDEKERELSNLWIEITENMVSNSIKSKKMNDEIFLLKHNTEIAGMLWLGVSRDEFTCEETGCLLGLFVEPTYRGKGLGKKLLISAEHWCKEKGFVYLSLNVGKMNENARKLYKSSGFEDRSYVMRKVLKKSV